MALQLDRIRERLDLYEKLMRLDKPIGILLLLWPTLWALWLSALGKPDWIVLWVFILGTVLAPTLAAALWFSIFGGTALNLEIFKGIPIAEAVKLDVATLERAYDDA